MEITPQRLVVLALIVGAVTWKLAFSPPKKSAPRRSDPTPQRLAAPSAQSGAAEIPDEGADASLPPVTLPPLEEHPQAVGQESVAAQDAARQEALDQQRALTGDFLRSVKLQFKLPENMHFAKLDLEDYAAGIYGVSAQTGEQFALIASHKTGTLEQVKEFVGELKAGLPILAGADLTGPSGKGEQTLKAPAGSGLADVRVFPVGKSGGSEIYAAYVERADGRGGYLLMLRAPASTFSENEGLLDSYLSNARVIP